MTPLTDRPADAVLFRLPDRIVTATQFAAHAQRLAATLPDARYAINLCTGRYAFTLAFAAALLRGQASLMAADRSPDRIAALATAYPGAYALTDAMVPPLSDETAPSPAIPNHRIAAIVFTSGSTGAPVAHTKTWGALAERSRAAALAFALDTPVTITATVPPQHMYGFETSVLLPLHAPAATWCGPAFYPADIRAALAATPTPRILVTTPLQLRALLQTERLPAIARIISATAPLDPAMAAAAESQWSTTVSEIFGASEVGSLAARDTTAGPEWTPYPGLTLTATEEGLHVIAPHQPDLTLDDHTEILPDGRFRLLGRRSDVVKLGGRRASLAGLNRILAAIDGVEDSAFLPPPADDHHASARMTAFVVAPHCAGDAILAALRPQIDPVFLPRRIVHVDRLPRNELGKLPLGALRALQAAG